MAMDTHHSGSSLSLVPDLIKNILLRLPVKSLLRFQSVSKFFRSLITSPRFVSEHLSRSSSSSAHLLLHRFINLPSASDFSIALIGDFNGNPILGNVAIPFLDSLVRFPKIVGSCNGLVCVDISLAHASGFVLWNIAIRQFRVLPSPTINANLKSVWMAASGFGFNRRTNDYKVVRIVHFGSDDDGDFGTKAELYSRSSGCWRVLESRMVEEGIGCFVVSEGQKAVYADGCLNWIANRVGDYSVKKCVISFDMDTDEFSRIAIPDFGSAICVKIMNCRDSLALAYYPAMSYGRSISGVELWVLEALDSNNKSWTKLYSIDLSFLAMGTPICVQKDFELLVHRVCGEYNSLAFLNPKDQAIRNIPVCSSGYTCQFQSYVESLVPVCGSGADEPENQD